MIGNLGGRRGRELEGDVEVHLGKELSKGISPVSVQSSLCIKGTSKSEELDCILETVVLAPCHLNNGLSCMATQLSAHARQFLQLNADTTVGVCYLPSC